MAGMPWLRVRKHGHAAGKYSLNHNHRDDRDTRHEPRHGPGVIMNDCQRFGRGANSPLRERSGRPSSTRDADAVDGAWRTRPEDDNFQFFEVVIPNAQGSKLEKPTQHQVAERDKHDASCVAHSTHRLLSRVRVRKRDRDLINVTLHGHDHHEQPNGSNTHNRGSLPHPLNDAQKPASAEKWDTTGSARLIGTDKIRSGRGADESRRGICSAHSRMSVGLNRVQTLITIVLANPQCLPILLVAAVATSDDQTPLLRDKRPAVFAILRAAK